VISSVLGSFSSLYLVKDENINDADNSKGEEEANNRKISHKPWCSFHLQEA